MRKYLTMFVVCILVTMTTQSIYSGYYQQALNIATAMSLDQKIGQTIQADFGCFILKNGTDPAEAIKYHLGSLLVGGDGVPDANGNLIEFPEYNEEKQIEGYSNGTMDKWQKLAAKFNYDIKITTNQGKTYVIKPLLATDAVHNNQHVAGTILFPHNIGLSCSHNADHFYNVGYWSAENVRKSGFNYAFAPTVAVSHNPQWGRFYQTMGQQQNYVYAYGKAYTEGLQRVKDNKVTSGVIGSVKHFFGDGATLYGADEGTAIVGSHKSFISHNIQGYNGSIASNIGSVMCSYSAINWLPLAIGPQMGTILRNTLEFDGLIISDYDEMNRLYTQQLPTSFQTMTADESLSMAMNAGIDMFMLPSYVKRVVPDYINTFKVALENKTISMERLNDAVARILSVKLAMGIATQQQNLEVEATIQPAVKLTTQYEDSLNAVHESLVLLKSDNTIPLKVSSLEYVVLVGESIININNLAKNQLFKNYDNIGMQCGGWSLRWQGFNGNSQWKDKNKQSSKASSLLDALVNLKQKFEIVQPNYTTYTQTTRIDIERNEYISKLKTLRKKMNSKNTIILGVIGQTPYAQFGGDVNIPYCQNDTVIGGVGCLYDNIPHVYLSNQQKNTLQLSFDKFEKEVISTIREEDKNIPVVSILFSGRPMLIDEVLTESNTVIAAFLPGTSGGEGVVDALVGNYVMRPNGQSDVRNTLSFDWPRNMSQLANFPIYKADGLIPRIEDPLFKVGYGLSTFKSSQQQDEDDDI